MGLNLADTYYLKAKSAVWGFCGDWEEACEALNYALSYDETHCPSLCLLGEIYAKNLNQFTEAFACFDQVIATDSSYIDVYPIYVKYLIWADEQERAQKLIDFALSLKGVGRGSLLQLSSYISETQGAYKASLRFLKAAKKESYNDSFFAYIEDEERRIKKKRKLNKKKKKHNVKRRKNGRSNGFQAILITRSIISLRYLPKKHLATPSILHLKTKNEESLLTKNKLT